MLRYFSAQPPNLNSQDKPGQAPRMEEKDPLSPMTVVIFSTFLGVAIFLIQQTKRKREQLSKDVEVESQGTPSFGGDFELVNKHNEVVRMMDQKGHILMMYFGFIHCPDICPAELEKLAKAKQMLDRAQVPAKLLFVSLDPSRDTPPKMKEQVQPWESKFKVEIEALTGSEEQVAFVKKQQRLYSSASEKDEDGNQNVDHTVATYVVNPDGIFVNVMPQIWEADKCAKTVTQQYKEWKLKNFE